MYREARKRVERVFTESGYEGKGALRFGGETGGMKAERPGC